MPTWNLRKMISSRNKLKKESEGNKHENLARILLFWYSLRPLEGRKSKNGRASNQTCADQKHYQSERGINKREKENKRGAEGDLLPV